MTVSGESTQGAPRPYSLVAELTHRCPLACAYCSNPLEREPEPELSRAAWQTAFEQAEALGVVQLHLSGGEPLLRADLEELVECARGLRLYSHLVTSGLPLERKRLARLVEAGLDAIQVSIQSLDATRAKAVCGRAALDAKLQVAAWAGELRLPLTLNCVLHRQNLEEVPALLELAESLGAERLELANAQYLGWALVNRDALLPTASQLMEARELVARARERLRGKMEVLFVTPDYFTGRPRACMDGWGRRTLVVTPTGRVLPCQAAASLPGLEFWSVADRSLSEVWSHSPGLSAFRGEDWMREPCKTCPERARDFGGCRCQAFALTGDAAEPDPACHRVPSHGLVRRHRQRPGSGLLPPFALRRMRGRPR